MHKQGFIDHIANQINMDAQKRKLKRLLIHLPLL